MVPESTLPQPHRGGLSPAARLLHAFVRGYRWLFAGRASPCRFYPSCSTYALEALEIHGAPRGGILAARRLLRCHPWGGHGIDLVPPPRGGGRPFPERSSI